MSECAITQELPCDNNLITLTVISCVSLTIKTNHSQSPISYQIIASWTTSFPSSFPISTIHFLLSTDKTQYASSKTTHQRDCNSSSSFDTAAESTNYCLVHYTLHVLLFKPSALAACHHRHYSFVRLTFTKSQQKALISVCKFDN